MIKAKFTGIQVGPVSAPSSSLYCVGNDTHIWKEPGAYRIVRYVSDKCPFCTLREEELPVSEEALALFEKNRIETYYNVSTGEASLVLGD